MARILVVDDEQSIRITLKAFLERDGHEVDVSDDAFAGFKLFKDKEHDIVLSDIIMPGKSGLDLLRDIRSINVYSQVIIMTGEPTVDTAVKAVKDGANDYLYKPIHKEALLKIISKAAQIKMLHDEKIVLEKEKEEYLAQLEQRVQERTKDLQKALQGTVLMFATAIAGRDSYTAGHQHRVGNLAAAIAKELNYSAKEINMVRIAGYLHDIGKITVPVEILTKADTLNEYELGIIRLHAQKSYEILAKTGLPEVVINAVYQHHERLNGSGYPNGLIRDEINSIAHILIVADVAEAMMSFRPYRQALGVNAALKELQQNANVKYSKEVVDACVLLLSEKKYILEGSETVLPF